MKLKENQVGAVCEDLLREQERRVRTEERTRAVRIIGEFVPSTVFEHVAAAVSAILDGEIR